ncbi:MAG: flagellin [Tepidiforma sp.]|nr:flagellin [Tepidiforma sp.]
MNVSFNDVRATQATGLNLLSGGGVDWTSASTIVASNTAAQAFINQIDAAITTLNTRRSDLGAAQNRLEHTVNSLGVAVENLTASESRIRDADVAQLSTQLVSSQILQQAGTAVLAQANQSSQAVLSLLR